MRKKTTLPLLYLQEIYLQNCHLVLVCCCHSLLGQSSCLFHLCFVSLHVLVLTCFNFDLCRNCFPSVRVESTMCVCLQSYITYTVYQWCSCLMLSLFCMLVTSSAVTSSEEKNTTSTTNNSSSSSGPMQAKGRVPLTLCSLCCYCTSNYNRES